MRGYVEKIFHTVVELSLEKRCAFYTAHDIDRDTRREVEELIHFDSQCTTSLLRDIGMIAHRVLEQADRRGLLCGPYRLTDSLGRGGMGAVYSAERVDGEVGQRVAVKLVRPGADDASLRQRFLTERKILETLLHPNIARLIDAGHREDGQPYLVMEHIEGRPIDAYTAELTVEQTITLFLKVCAAVSYLHQNRIIHRDLKPSNILVTRDGEPKLLDFGIAKVLERDDLTATGMRMLTPSYASPEQFSGGVLTTATDIYSLGAVLYKLLTGVPPHEFASDAAQGGVESFRNREITLPSKLVQAVDGDLEIVVMKALHREPEERYGSVQQLADDLEKYLASDSIRPRGGDAWK